MACRVGEWGHHLEATPIGASRAGRPNALEVGELVGLEGVLAVRRLLAVFERVGAAVLVCRRTHSQLLAIEQHTSSLTRHVPTVMHNYNYDYETTR